MKYKDLKKKSEKDLTKELEKIQIDLMKFRSQTATGGAGKDAGKIRVMRRTIARIKTLQNEVKNKQ